MSDIGAKLMNIREAGLKAALHKILEGGEFDENTLFEYWDAMMRECFSLGPDGNKFLAEWDTYTRKKKKEIRGRIMSFDAFIGELRRVFNKMLARRAAYGKPR